MSMRNCLEDTRTHPVGSRMSTEDHDEPAGFEQRTESTEEESDTGTEQDPKSDSNEEQMVEPVVENQGRRYPLRERRPPIDFRMQSMF